MLSVENDIDEAMSEPFVLLPCTVCVLMMMNTLQMTLLKTLVYARMNI
jgi:hypothetical protein